MPLATWVGQNIGWREAFGGTAALGLLTMAALWLALPASAPGARPEVRRELRVLTRPDVLIALLTTVLGASAMFALYTYVTPVLTTLAAASDSFVTLALVIIGLGFTFGNWLGGRVADWSLDGATAIFLAALTAIMLVAPMTLGSQSSALVTLFLWGAAAFAIVPPVQMRVMQAAAEAPGLASSVNIGAFNLGNAIGAALGGAVIAADFGYAAVPVVGGVTAAAGLALVWLGRRHAHIARCAA